MATSFPPRVTDERRALAGDRATWDALVAKHQRRVILSVLARGVPIDVAREVAQQAWLKLYERAIAGELEALDLPGLAVRQADFLLRDRKRREALSRDVEQQPLVVEVTEPRIIARDTLRVIERVVEECPTGQQRIFWAAQEQSHLGHTAIASSLGISVQHLRQTLTGVRQHIRTALEGSHD